MTEPKRNPHAILRVIGSRCNPNDGIGIAWSQSDELSDYMDSILAVSVSSEKLWSRFSYF